ncbi:hypothetical protein [Salinimicrobium sp. HB62]|uniref:hypothetical protein n=1 Tax=Salinimicrobium sp. HB62 TaxID=3077781 RepID=UPI002D7A1B14|nr:hypothetical protein [Salinimicrobium sp. HB62]
MKRLASIILTFSLPLLNISCSTEPDFSDTWIKYSTFDDYAHNDEHEVTEDTIYTSFTTPGKPLILQISIQSNDGSSPRFFRTVDKGERIEITNEVPMGGFYEHDNGTTRYIKEIDIMIPSNLFSAGQIIEYETIVGSSAGNISKTISFIIQ